MHTSTMRTALFLLSLTLTTAHPGPLDPLAPRTLNGGCTGADGVGGICVPTSECTRKGGKSIRYACPGDPDDVRCCTKPQCGTGDKGKCQFVSSCGGATEDYQCPGPASFKCCMPGGGGGGGGGGAQPPFPTAGCKQTAIDGARRIASQFPGVIKDIGCKRDCPVGTSEHCVGMATDLMVGDLGSKSDRGRPIAEWVKDHRAELNLYYVIWGQKIWNVERDAPDAPWAEWRGMDDRGSNTQNHWDHVHVSYK